MTNRELKIAISIVGALGGLVAVVAYFENKKTAKLKLETVLLEKQIKELQLAQLRKQSIAA